jgi:2-methylcitrate dehydratase
MKLDLDGPTRSIVDFVESAGNDRIGEAVSNAVVRLHFDAIGCAIGGLTSGPSLIARAFAQSALTPSGCSVVGIKETVAPEQAVFANVTFVRQLDYNDYNHEISGHPSDMIPAIVAAGEIAGASGADIVRGIYVAYEVAAAIGATYPVERAGWDHGGTAMAVGSAMGTGLVLGLGRSELANAVGIAVAPSMALGVTRKGELSNWKGSASAHEVMTGLLATRLAHLGLTGPQAAFEGVGGLHQQVKPTRALGFGIRPSGCSAAEETSFKYYPAVGNAQTLIGPLIGIHRQVLPKDIKHIKVETFGYMYRNLGGGLGDSTQKWAPKSRETADHSLPYIVAVCLLDGDITASSFSEERIQRPDIRSLMPLITVSENAAFTQKYPRHRLSSICIELRNGSTVKLSSEVPLGSYENPLDNSQLSQKFRKLSSPILSEKDAVTLECALWNLAELEELNDITRLYRAIAVS